MVPCRWQGDSADPLQQRKGECCGGSMCNGIPISMCQAARACCRRADVRMPRVWAWRAARNCLLRHALLTKHQPLTTSLSMHISLSLSA